MQQTKTLTIVPKASALIIIMQGGFTLFFEMSKSIRFFDVSWKNIPG